MIQLEVRDLVNRGFVTSTDLYKVQRPDAAAPAGAIVNASQGRGVETKANAKRTQMAGNRFSIDASAIFPNQIYDFQMLSMYNSQCLFSFKMKSVFL